LKVAIGMGKSDEKNTNQNKLGMLDWMLAIDFDPVETIRVRRDVPTVYASFLNKKDIEPKRGD
jgi:hypothetical protein